MILLGETELCSKWLCEHLPTSERGVTWDHAIGLKIRDKLEAAAGYCHFDGRDIDLTVAVDGQATPSFLRAMFRYPFIQLQCARITCHVADNNEVCIHTLGKLGFWYEGRKRDCFEDAKDALMFGMLRQECRYL